MAISIVQSATQVNVGASTSTAPSITLNGVTAGNTLLYVGGIVDLNITWSITDVTDGGDAFTLRQANDQGIASGSSSRSVVAFARNVSSGNKTVQANLAGTSAGAGRYYTLGLIEVSGADPEDDFAQNSNQDAGTTDLLAGGTGFTTTEADDLIIGAVAINTGTTQAAFGSPTSWTNRYRQNDGVNFTPTDVGTWLPGATQTNYTAQWTHTNNAGDDGSGTVVALKATAAPATGSLGQWDPELRLLAWF